MQRIKATMAFVLLGVMGLMAGRAEAGSVYSNAVLADNPQVYWQMNESPGATTAVDSAPAGGANDGSYQSGTNASNTPGGVTLGVPGAIINDRTNTAASFNGTNDGFGDAISTSNYLTASAATVGTLSSNYTVEFWFNNQRSDASAGAINAYLFDRGTTFSTSDLIGIDGTTAGAGLVPNDLFVWNGSDTNVVTTHFNPVEGTWYLLDLVRSGNTITLYINGVAQELYTGGTDDGASATLPATFTTSDILLGKRVDDTYPYDGLFDEAAIYGSALSASQLDAHFDASLPEPASFGLLIIGGAVVLGRRRRA